MDVEQEDMVVKGPGFTLCEQCGEAKNSEDVYQVPKYDIKKGQMREYNICLGCLDNPYGRAMSRGRWHP
jgi:hypothetical protein